MTVLLAYVFVALVFSFLCSIAEAVVLSVTPSYIASLKQQGHPAGPRLLRLKQHVDRPLAAILSLNTIAHTVGAVGAGAQAAVVFGNQYLGVASAVLTILILVLSEIIPKTLGARYWRVLAAPVAVALKVLIVILYPLVLLSEQLTRLMSRGHSVSLFNRDEFTALAELGVEEGSLDSSESHILQNLFRFRSVRVVDIMTPRHVVFALPADSTIAEVFATHAQIPFSRIPVYDGTLDKVSGFVLKQDLLLARAEAKDRTTVSDLRRDISVTREETSLPSLFQRLMHRRAHIALVIGREEVMTGIVTLEDLIETILGLEIVDESDTTVDMQELARRVAVRRVAHGTIPVGTRGDSFPDSERDAP